MRPRRPSESGRSPRLAVFIILLLFGCFVTGAAFYIRSKASALHEEYMAEISRQAAALAQHKTALEEAVHARQLAEQDAQGAQALSDRYQGEAKELTATASDAAEERDEAQQALDAARLEVERLKKQSEQLSAELQAANQERERLREAERNASSKVTLDRTVLDRHAPWGPSAVRDAQDPELAAILREVAINNEVLVAICNQNYAGHGNMLETWLTNVQRAGVKNAMVVALDAFTRDYVEAQGMVAYEMHLEISEAQRNVGSNHAVSGLKFKILQHFMRLGYAVLLSDVDIVTLKNPFTNLFRDTDVESMSDGWTNQTAYGYNDVLDDPAMGWARYAHSMRVFCFNSGLFYMRPTNASMDLLARVVHRLETEDGWDQAIFNEVIFFPSHNGYVDPGVTRRVMDMYEFMNSKTLFKEARHQAIFGSLHPTLVHLNSHPDKLPRMRAVEAYFRGLNPGALQAFPDGSE